MADKYIITLDNVDDPLTIAVRISDIIVAEQEGQRRGGWGGPVADLTLSYLVLQMHKAARREYRDRVPEKFEDFRDALADFERIEGGAPAVPFPQEVTPEANRPRYAHWAASSFAF